MDGLASLTNGVRLMEETQTGRVISGPGAKRDSKPTKLHKLSRSQEDCLLRAKKYAMEQGIKRALLKQTINHQQKQMVNVQMSVQRQQALALMCRVYVGSINFEIKEDTIKQAFSPFGPIKSISVPYDNVSKKHKGFAFIEFDFPEAASIALEQMNGVMISGFSIKVGRPSNMPQAQPIIERILEESKMFNRIYISSIHEDLGESDIKSVFEAFGRILSCKLAVDPTRPAKHKGCGYIEYETAQSCTDAVSAMNLFDIGGQHLRVGKAVTPPNACQVPPVMASILPTASAIAAAAATAKITALEAVNLAANPPSLPPPGVAVPVLGPSGVLQPPLLIAQSMMVPPPLPFGVTAPSFPTTLMNPGSASLSLQPPPLLRDLASGDGVGGVTMTQLPHQSLGGVVHQAFSGTFLQPSTTQAFTAPGMMMPPPVPPIGLNFPAPFASAPVRPIAPPSAVGSLSANMADLPEPQQTIEAQENMQIKGSQARLMVMQRLMRKTESRVMLLNNMVGPDEVDDDLEEEVSEECSKYGAVSRISIFLERQSEELDAETIVKIFVEFSSQSEMEKAVTSLHGRHFAGRSIQAKPYDQDMFDNNDLSG